MNTDIPLPVPSLLDGATATELQKVGMPPEACTGHWILEHPEALLELQRSYVAAGSQLLTAPTFGCSPASLEVFGLKEQTEECNRRLVELSRQAAGDKAKVLGNLSSCGLGKFGVREGRFEDVVDDYKGQVKALAEAGVDGYLVETMTDMAEARAAVLAIRELDDGKPILVTFYCDDESRTPSGVDVLAALSVMQGMGVTAFGLSCMAPAVMLEQLERLAPYAEIPLIAQPDGMQQHGENFTLWCDRAADLGVRFFGGCCGSGAEEIAALRSKLDSMEIEPFRPMERDPDVILCASEREARFVTPDVDLSEPIECTSDLVEDILDVEENTPVGAIQIEIMEEDDVLVFAEHQYAIEDALCLWCDVPELLEKALRVYQGRALYDGTCDLEPEELQPLVEKYGLILL